MVKFMGRARNLKLISEAKYTKHFFRETLVTSWQTPNYHDHFMLIIEGLIQKENDK